MVELLILVEGHTEQLFVRQVLAVELATRGIAANARLLGKPGHKGGFKPYPQVRKEMVGLLKEKANRYCTSMFDYYCLPKSWPGRREASQMRCPQNAAYVEEQTHKDVCDKLGSSFDKARFLPYVQLHEFEALLFSDTAKLSQALNAPHVEPQFAEVVRQFRHPEAIDDNRETAPSKRIKRIAGHFQKTLHGITAAKDIGLDVMRQKCPHFAEWLGKLERLAV